MIERQKIRIGALQVGSHKDVVEIDGKMHEHAVFEFKNRILVRPVEFIMTDGVVGILPGELVFELHRHHGNAVQKQHDVDAVLVGYGIVQLTSTVEDIALILRLCRLVDRGLRLPVGDAEMMPRSLKS